MTQILKGLHRLQAEKTNNRNHYKRGTSNQVWKNMKITTTRLGELTKQGMTTKKEDGSYKTRIIYVLAGSGMHCYVCSFEFRTF